MIEDEQRIRELAARVLAESGHDVATEGTAMRGLQAVVDAYLYIVPFNGMKKARPPAENSTGQASTR